MGLEQVIQLITTYGMSVVIIAYFLFKDYKFNENITKLLSEVKEVLTVMKETLIDK